MKLRQGLALIISVKTLTGKTILLDVNSLEFIKGVKAEIWNQEGIPPDEQRLFFEGKELEVELIIHNDPAIQRKSIGPLVLLLRGMIIFVKTPIGKTINLEVKPSDSIQTVKKMVKDKIGIPSDEQNWSLQERS